MFHWKTNLSDGARRLMCAFLIACTGTGPVSGAVSQSATVAGGRLVSRSTDEDMALEQFLTRLGLETLRVEHLERTLKQSHGGADEQLLAVRLADLYAERLMQSASDQVGYASTLERVKELLGRFPGANTASLQVMLLQADYQRAEVLVGRWISDPDDQGARSESTAILQRIAPLLDKYQADLNGQVERKLEELDTMESKEEIGRAERDLGRVQTIAGRATYFAAWSAYYLALVTDAELDSPAYQRSRAIFRQLMGLDGPVDDEVEAELLRLDSIWRARALIGLGLTESACRDAAAREHCFRLLEDADVAPAIKDQAPYWHLRALMAAGDQQTALDLARRRVGRMQPPASQGQVSFCVALVRFGFGSPASAASGSKLGEIGRLGLTGLARLDQLSAIDKLIKKYAIDPTADAGFVLYWARGQQRFGVAEKSGQKSDYAAAAKLLEQALASDDARSLLGPASRCRYTLGWCLYRQQQIEQAAQQFSKAAPGLAAAKDKLAADALWMTFVTYKKLSEAQPRMTAAAADVLRQIQKKFPDHPYARRARYEAMRLMEDRPPSEIIAQLEQVDADDPNYPAARFDICQLSYQQWKKESARGADATFWINALRASADKYLQIPKGTRDSKRAVQCGLFVADAALHHESANDSMAAQFLSRVEPLVGRLKDDDRLKWEFHYRQLELATRRNDGGQRTAQANWLAEHAGGSNYELSALLIVANGLDRELQAAGSAATPASLDRARAAYRRLVDLLGDDPGQLARSRNARVALSKWAAYSSRLGDHQRAADAMERLLKEKPHDRNYLKRAAQAQQAAGRFDSALVHWRTLVAGSTQGSDRWYEAKYFQLQCLAQTDREKASKVYRQMKLLHPELGGAAWESKFRKLTAGW